MEFKLKLKSETKDESISYMICFVFFACTNAAIFVSKQGEGGYREADRVNFHISEHPCSVAKGRKMMMRRWKRRRRRACRTGWCERCVGRKMQGQREWDVSHTGHRWRGRRGGRGGGECQRGQSLLKMNQLKSQNIRKGPQSHFQQLKNHSSTLLLVFGRQPGCLPGRGNSGTARGGLKEHCPIWGSSHSKWLGSLYIKITCSYMCELS